MNRANPDYSVLFFIGCIAAAAALIIAVDLGMRAWLRFEEWRLRRAIAHRLAVSIRQALVRQCVPGRIWNSETRSDIRKILNKHIEEISNDDENRL